MGLACRLVKTPVGLVPAPVVSRLPRGSVGIHAPGPRSVGSVTQSQADDNLMPGRCPSAQRPAAGSLPAGLSHFSSPRLSQLRHHHTLGLTQ